MKYFLLLVQEMEVKIPAPVCEVVTHAVAPPSPPLVLHGKIDTQSRCLMATALLLSFMASYLHSLATPTLLPSDCSASSAPLLSVCTQKGNLQIGLLMETQNYKSFCWTSQPLTP